MKELPEATKLEVPEQTTWKESGGDEAIFMVYIGNGCSELMLGKDLHLKSAKHVFVDPTGELSLWTKSGNFVPEENVTIEIALNYIVNDIG